MGRGASEESLAVEATRAETRSDLDRARRAAEASVIEIARLLVEVGASNGNTSLLLTRLRDELDRHDSVLRDLRSEAALSAPQGIAEHPAPYTLSPPLAFRVLDVLRLTHIYALKDSIRIRRSLRRTSTRTSGSMKSRSHKRASIPTARCSMS